MPRAAAAVPTRRAFAFTLIPICAALAAGFGLGAELKDAIGTSVSCTPFSILLRLSVAGAWAVLAAIGISAWTARALARPFRLLGAHLDRLNRQFDGACLEFVETMAQALEARDPYTAGHSNRVRDYSVAIARAMRLPPEEIEVIRVGAQLHDIGKIGIPDSVLQKTGDLTPQEYELVKRHPQIGKKILEQVGRFEKYLPIVELHHEDQDGGGYPFGLTGQEVPLAVRIVHVADVYDALTSNRAYRNAMPRQMAHEMIELSAGMQFDPEVVRVFSAILRAEAPAPETDELRDTAPAVLE